MTPEGSRSNPNNEVDHSDSLRVDVSEKSTNIPEVVFSDAPAPVTTESNWQPSTGTEQRTADDSERKKVGFWTKGKLIAALAIGGVAAAGGTTAAVISNQPTAEAPADPGEAPVEPGETEAPVESETPSVTETLPTAEDLEIPAGLSPEVTAESVVELFSSWMMTGADKTTYDIRYTESFESINLNEYIDIVAAERAPTYAQALYGENWQDPSFKQSVDWLQELNRQVLKLHYQTYGSQNSSQYQAGLVFNELLTHTDNEDGTVSHVVSITQDNNAGEGNIVKPNDTDRHEITVSFTTTESNGTIHLATPAVFE